MLGYLFHCHNKNAQRRQSSKEGFIFAYSSRAHSLPWQGSVARTGGDCGHNECTDRMRLKNECLCSGPFHLWEQSQVTAHWIVLSTFRVGLFPIQRIFERRISRYPEIYFNSHSAFSRFIGVTIIGAEGFQTSCIPVSSQVLKDAGPVVTQLPHRY